MVTPAVNWSLARLNPDLTYQHGAGFTNYTKLFSVAVCYVFVTVDLYPYFLD